MVATMTPELQRYYEDYLPYKMTNDLIKKYHKQACQEKYKVVKYLIASNMKDG